jgi:hypothetical protein
LVQALPDGRTSPNQIPVLDFAWTFLATVLTGGRRFAHLERLRSDAVVRAILGVTRMPSAMTLTRYFGGLVRSQIEHLSAVLGQFVLRGLHAPALGAVLDLDSTVFERYGHQQGSLKGYNPRKHGRPSRPGESHPEALTDSGREPLDSSGSCHRMKTAAFRQAQSVPPVSG